MAQDGPNRRSQIREVTLSICMDDALPPFLVAMHKHFASMLMIAAYGAHGADNLPRYDNMLALEKVAVTSGNVSTGDLNGDGHLDVIIANGRHWPLISRVFFGDGKGRFSAG